MSETLHPTPAPVPLAPPVNTLGRASLIVGIVLGVLQLGATVIAYLLPYLARTLQASYQSLALVNTGIAVVVLIVGAVAAILGLVALSRPGLPRGAAGAGAALGIAAVAHTLFGLGVGPLLGVVLR